MQRKPKTVEDRIVQALGDVYECIGHDVWGDDAVPDDDEFVDVISDQFGNCARAYRYASDEDIAAFYALDEDQKRQLCLRAGP